MRLSLIVSIILLISFSYAQTVEFDQAARVKKENENAFQEVKSGDKIDLKESESLLVVTDKGLPVVVYAPGSKFSKILISESNMTALLQEQMKTTLNQSTSEIVNELRKSENLIQKKDYNQALNTVTQLKNKYPGISSIYFMSGTLYYLLNNKSSAVEDLQKGLKIEPTNEAAQKLLAKLKAGGA